MENKYRHFCSFCHKILYNSFIGRIIIAVYNFFSNLASGSFIFNMFNRGTVDKALSKNSVFQKIRTFFSNILEVFYRVLRKSFIVNTVSKSFNILLNSPLSCITCIAAPLALITALFSFFSKNFYIGIFMILLFFISFIFLKNIKIKNAVSASFFPNMIFKLIGLDVSNFEEIPVSVKKSHIVCILAGIICGGLSYFSILYGVIALAAFIGAFMVFSVKPIVFGCIFMFSVPLLPTLVNVAIIFVFFINFIFARALGKIQGKNINFVEFFAIMFMLFIFISSILSVTPLASIQIAAVWLVMIMSFFIIRRCIENKKDLTAILTSFSVAALITGIYGIFQYFYGQLNTSWVDTSLFEDLKFRVYSTFENPNVYGEYLLLAIPVVAGLAFLINKKIGKTSCFLILCILIADVFLTYSRGCYLGLALCIFMIIWLFDTKLIGVAVFAAVPCIFLLPSSITNRLLSITNLADSSTSYRVKIWHGTLKMLEDFAFTGIGPGTQAYELVNPRYAFEGVIAQHSHSLFLQIITDMGIFAFIIFLAMLFCYIRNGISTIRNTCNFKNKIFMSVFIAALFGFLIQSIFDYTWYNYRVFMIFWIFIALGSTAFELFKPSEKSEKIKEDKKHESS